MAGGPGVIKYLEAALKATSLRGKLIGNNLANIETPNYRRADVRFEEMLAKALSGGREADVEGLEPEVFEPRDMGVNENGNDVSLDVEIGEMIKNDLQTKVYLRTMAKLYSQMHMAIQD